MVHNYTESGMSAMQDAETNEHLHGATQYERPFPSLTAEGTMEHPTFNNATDEEIALIVQTAQERNQPVYWTFEGTRLCVHPDGTLEFARQTKPLRDEVQGFIREGIAKVLQSEK